MLKIKNNLNNNINRLPLDIQLVILEYYNEVKTYFILNVLPFILLKNKIKLHYNENEFIHLKLNDNEHHYLKLNNNEHHYLINVSNIISLETMMFIEYELNNIIIPSNIKNIWIKIHITETINYFGGTNHSIIEVLYINKYNYNYFAIKIIKYNKTNIYIIKQKKKINLLNYCNYFSSKYFMHLPQSAINQLNN